MQVALHHTTLYKYDRPVTLSPQVIRLRPCPHSRTQVSNYALQVHPEPNTLHWQQDPLNNYLARVVFPGEVSQFKIEVHLTAELEPINPFDFFLEPNAQTLPFTYDPILGKPLRPFLDPEPIGPRLQTFLSSVNPNGSPAIEFLVNLNRSLRQQVAYLIRLDPGVQSCEQTLEAGSGSCRDSAWLLVQILRHLGLAARFVSGYLIETESASLHAWSEVYLPGAGWIGLDPTSGLLAGEGHVPLAGACDPDAAAPISGTAGPCQVQFSHEILLKRS